MPRSARFLLPLLLLTMTTRALAQDVQTIPPGEDKIVSVREGDKSPFTGQLFDQQTALRWANWLQQYKLRLKIDVEQQKKLSEVEVGFVKQLLQIEKDKYAAVTQDYQTRSALQQTKIQELEAEIKNPPWYSSVWFGAALGVLTTTLAVSLGAFALHAAK